MAQTAEQIEANLDEAMATARAAYPDEKATSIRYVRDEELFVLVLHSGARIVIPREELQFIATATQDEAADVVLDMGDAAVWFRTLDIAFGVKGLADGLYGNEDWMKQLAARNHPKAA